MIFDGHGDILTDIEQKARFGIDVFKDFHLPMYNQADVIGSIFVNYTDPSSTAQRYTFEQINKVAVPYLLNSSVVNVVSDDLGFRLGKLNVVLGIEGAKPLPNLQAVKAMYELGYRHLGIVWNERNQFGCGVDGIGGLTELGEQTIKWCNANGMIVDFAHMNFQTFLDAAFVSNKPILFSHGNVHALCPHKRNLTDKQIELVVKSGGVIGLSAINDFLTTKRQASVDDLISHILYIKNKFGIKYVGLGFDFCYYLDDLKNNDVVGLENMGTVANLKAKLRGAGLSDEEIDAVMFKNMLRVVKANLKGDQNEV